MSFKDLKEGYENGHGKENKQLELTPEEKDLLETKDVDKLSARAKMRMQFLRNKMALDKQLENDQKAGLSD